MARPNPDPEPVYVDSRIGSKDLYPLLLQRGTRCELLTLPFGDACFVGRGPRGPEVIGIERKGVHDLAQSLTSGRLVGHQIPGLVATYPFRWVVVEGVYRTGEHGFLEVPRGRGHWGILEPRLRGQGLDGWLLTLTLRSGTFIQRTRDPDETADWLVALYKWWTEKAWAEHDGHLSLPPQVDKGTFAPPSLLRKMAATLPGIGWERSGEVEKVFASIADMVLAEESRWQTVKGIGPIVAKGVVNALRGKTS